MKKDIRTHEADINLVKKFNIIMLLNKAINSGIINMNKFCFNNR